MVACWPPCASSRGVPRGNPAGLHGQGNGACQTCDRSDGGPVKVAAAPTMYSERAVIDSTPKAVGRYQILDRLAVGGMAELFKATLTGDPGFEKLVAIKKILPHLAPDKSVVEMFIDEARITAQLDHRHIVQVFELGTDADTPYIAMQYVDGLDVLALLRECARAQIRLQPDVAALIARDVLDALDYAHNALDS